MKKSASPQKFRKESLIAPTPTTDLLDSQWLSIERQRLDLEREKFEFRRIEAVSRLAMELGLGIGGHGPKTKRSPDIEGAIKLRAGSRRALDGMNGRGWEGTINPEIERVFNDFYDRETPPLYWYPAKTGYKPESSSQVLTWGALCNQTAKPNEWITVGVWKYEVEEAVCVERHHREWVKIGEEIKGKIKGWEVLRDGKYGQSIIREALGIICSQSKEMEGHAVSDSDVTRVMEAPVILEPFYRALLEARKRLGSKSQKGSAVVIATPPRGKRTAGR
jgi:hypothetical protein